MIDQYIAWFQISVQNLPRVTVSHSREYLEHETLQAMEFQENFNHNWSILKFEVQQNSNPEAKT